MFYSLIKWKAFGKMAGSGGSAEQAKQAKQANQAHSKD
jgi:hypothetical protein